eukprot:5138737-Amphidinium_carterae.1
MSNHWEGDLGSRLPVHPKSYWPINAERKRNFHVTCQGGIAPLVSLCKKRGLSSCTYMGLLATETQTSGGFVLAAPAS